MFTAPRLVAGAVTLVALYIAAVPSVVGMDPAVAGAAALCLAAVAFWGSGALPEHVTAFGFFLVAMLLQIAPPGVVFAGFASNAWWLVVGGLVIGVAVKRTGLGDWLAHYLVGALGRGYLGLISGIVLVGVVLSFLMPSTMGRALIAVPVVMAMADRFGFAPGSRGRNGMVLAMVVGTFMPSAAILPANVANMVLAGAAETIHGVTFTYGSYFFLHFPVIGFLKAVLVVLVTWAMFRDTPADAEHGGEARPPLTAMGRKVGVILVGALVMWATDEWHGINPAWVAVAAALLCLLPGFGPVNGEAFNKEMNVGPMFYVAGVLGMGAVLATQGVADYLGDVFLAVVPLDPATPFWNYLLLSVFTSVLGLGTTVPGIPAVMTPLAGDIAAASGFSLMAVLMVIVVGFSNVILPYQLPPLVVSMQLAEIRVRDGARLTLAVTGISLVLFTPLNYLWWRVVGIL